MQELCTVIQLNTFGKAENPEAAVDELCCGRQTNVLVAWLQRNGFQGGRMGFREEEELLNSCSLGKCQNLQLCCAEVCGSPH